MGRTAKAKPDQAKTFLELQMEKQGLSFAELVRKFCELRPNKDGSIPTPKQRSSTVKRALINPQSSQLSTLIDVMKVMGGRIEFVFPREKRVSMHDSKREYLSDSIAYEVFVGCSPQEFVEPFGGRVEDAIANLIENWSDDEAPPPWLQDALRRYLTEALKNK